jgi:hypothetical protein
MICTEDQFRSILREEAADITPDSVPPLRLPDRQLADPGRGRGRGSGTRWRRVLVSLGAAAAVTAIAVAATIAGGSNRAPQRLAAVSPPLHGVPRYYFVVTGSSARTPADLVVHDTASGTVLASAPSPHGCHFTQVSAAADDRTVALACAGGALPAGAMRLFLGRFNPATGRLSVAALRLPLIQNYLTMALSQDDRRIAVVSVRDNLGRQAESTLRVYSLMTGAVRTWTSPGTVSVWVTQIPNVPTPAGLQWGPGAQLLFVLDRSNTEVIRLLTVDAPPGDLLTASRFVLQADFGNSDVMQGATLSSDGSTVAAAVAHFDGNYTMEFAEFSTATGRLLRRWAPAGSSGYGLLWSGSSGRTLLAATLLGPATGTRSRGTGLALAIVTGNRVIRLPSAIQSWADIAF